VNAFVVDANTIQVQVVSGVNSGNNNFLDRLNAPAPGSNTISGFAIRDVNLNGSASGEPGLAGMTVVLSDQFGTPLASVVTDVTGAFSFTGLQGGTYTLTATPPFGLNSTNAIVGQNGLRLSPNSIRVTTSFGLTNYPGQLFLAGP
jgi:large repetitive protein